MQAKTANKFSPEVRARAVRMVLGHEREHPSRWAAIIDDHREAYGIEPICRVLPVAPSTYRDHLAKRRDPARLPAWAQRGAALAIEVRRVLLRLPCLWRAQGLAAVAAGGLRCCPLHGRPADAENGPRRRHPWQTDPHHRERQSRPLSAGQGQSAVPRFGAE
jgi:hypothetical protein